MAHESCHEIHMIYLSWDVSWGHFKIHGENIDVSGTRSLVVFSLLKGKLLGEVVVSGVSSVRSEVKALRNGYQLGYELSCKTR